MSKQFALIFSRFTTRFGDYSWQFALPMMIILVFPNSLFYVAIFSLSCSLGTALVAPAFGQWLETSDRLRASRLLIAAQIIGTFLSGFLLYASSLQIAGYRELFFYSSIVFGLCAQVGGLLNYQYLISDWVPRLFSDHELAVVNSRFKRFDLFAEVLGPVVAGLVLSLGWGGFLAILFYNLLSFLIEFYLLTCLYRGHASALSGVVSQRHSGRLGGLEQYLSGFRILAAQPVFSLVLATTCLWFTVLSPHSPILQSYLKGAWHFDESFIGLVTAGGAVCALVPTFVFNMLRRRFGLLLTTQGFIFFQSLMVVLSAIGFHNQIAWIFVSTLLLSRIGLYGFLLGELEIRQTLVAPQFRNQVASCGSAIQIATGVLMSISALLADYEWFSVLIWASAAAVCAGAILSRRGRGLRLVSKQL